MLHHKTGSPDPAEENDGIPNPVEGVGVAVVVVTAGNPPKENVAPSFSAATEVSAEVVIDAALGALLGPTKKETNENN